MPGMSKRLANVQYSYLEDNLNDAASWYHNQYNNLVRMLLGALPVNVEKQNVMRQVICAPPPEQLIISFYKSKL